MTSCWLRKTLAALQSGPTVLAVALGLWFSAPASAQAGVMLPWRNCQSDAASLAAALLIDDGSACGELHSTANASDAADTERNPIDSVRSVFLKKAIQTTGGASAPASSPTGSPSSTSVMVAPASVADRPQECNFNKWRESSPEFPRPPACELLDPPKACA